MAGGGLVCLTGILLALSYRQISGEGQLVQVNMVDGSSFLATFPRQHLTQPEWNRPRGENLLDGAAPFYEVYATEDDRFVAVGSQEPRFYDHLISGLGFDKSAIPDRETGNNWPTLKELFAARFESRQWKSGEPCSIIDMACVTPVLHTSEVEGPHQPLVHLAASPSRDVSIQDSFPQLERGEGSNGVLYEWLPGSCKDNVITYNTTGVSCLLPRAKL